MTIGVLLFLGSIIMFTPVGPKLRGYAGRILSYGSTKLKADKTIPASTYDWIVYDLSGYSHALSNEKGKVVFLNLWATWCKPCLEELPDIQMLYDDYGDKVSFLLVTEEKPERVANFASQRPYNLPFYLSKKEIPVVFSSSTIPTTYILNKHGKIILAENGVMNWNSAKIRNLLNQLLAE